MTTNRLDENHRIRTSSRLLQGTRGLSKVDIELDKRHPHKSLGGFSRASQSLSIGELLG